MRAASFGLFSALLVACVSDPSIGDAGKQTGEEGGPCFSDFTCKTGLICNLGPNLCVKPGTDGAIVDTGTDGAPSDAPGSDAADGGGTCIGNTLAWWQGDSTLNDHFNVATLMAFGTTNYTPNGKVKNAFDLGGSGHYSAQITTLGGLSQMSLEFWVKVTALPAVAQHLFVFTDANAQPIWTVDIVANASTLSFNLGTGTVQATISTGAYHHVAFTFANATIQSYVGGAMQAAMGANIQTIPMTGSILTIGADADGGANFVGQLDEIALYKTALSGTDLQAIVAADSAGICRLK